MKKRIDIALLIGLIASIMLTSLGVFARDCDQIKREILRLHIIAASDSADDQRAKYAVRDRLLLESDGLFSDTGKGSSIETAAENLPELERIAAEALAERGITDTVKAEIVRMYFDTRFYDGVAVAAGWYDALRITIGDGGGKNWWCVMFPPICLPAAEAGDTEYPEQELLESVGGSGYIPKFAVLELIEEARNYFDSEGQPE